MIIRLLRPDDLPVLREIHEKQYATEFQFPVWEKFMAAFTVESSDGRIITSGGVRPLAEAIAITDKNMPVRLRRAALLQLLEATTFITANQGVDQLHAFVMEDDNWIEHLKKYGFHDCKGKALVGRVL